MLSARLTPSSTEMPGSADRVAHPNIVDKLVPHVPVSNNALPYVVAEIVPPVPAT